MLTTSQKTGEEQEQLALSLLFVIKYIRRVLSTGLKIDLYMSIVLQFFNGVTRESGFYKGFRRVGTGHALSLVSLMWRAK